jgi:hypothetical protein
MFLEGGNEVHEGGKLKAPCQERRRAQKTNRPIKNRTKVSSFLEGKSFLDT